MLGRDGSTASSIRNLMKASAAGIGAHILLQFLSLEDEQANSPGESGRD